MSLPKSITDLSERFSSLPGVGPNLSNRIALYLAITNKKLSERLQDSLKSINKDIRKCKKCFNVTDNEDFCEICLDDSRDHKTLLIVETPLELYTIEDTGEFNGLYHVTHGIISPVNGIGPMDLTIQDLLERVENEDIEELIFGFNPTIEGDSTAMYITNEIKKIKDSIRLTRLAKGIPSGSSIEYMSSQTLSDSLKRRDQLDLG